MSYILEALKKSDEERNRGSAPGLQTVHTASVREAGKARWWVYLLTFALLLNAGMLLWWLQPWRHSGADVNQPSGGSRTVAPEKEVLKIATGEHSAKTTSTGPALPEQAKEKLVPASQPKPGADVKISSGGESAESAGEPKESNKQFEVARPAATPESEPAHATQLSAQKGTEQTVPPPAPAAPAKRTEAAQAVKTKPPVPALPAPDRPAPSQQNVGTENADQLARMHAKALDEAIKSPAKVAKPDPGVSKAQEPAESSVAHLRSLPISTRQQIPELALSFLVYSDNPADRMININGQMMREGQEVAPGLKLEEITPEGATFNFRGIRFRKGIL